MSKTMKHIQFVLLLFLSSLLLLNYAYSEEIPKTCNCDSLIVTGDEEAGGCTADVKREVCAQYRQMQILRESERLREQAKRFESYRSAIRVEGGKDPLYVK